MPWSPATGWNGIINKNMKDYQQHEQFELEVLNLLFKNQLLNSLIFYGGTALRLCFSLNRYSVDLDFLAKETFSKEHFKKIKNVLEEKYKITDFQEKYYSFLLEIKSDKYPKKLKIEIHKEVDKSAKTEINIAFSKFSPYQVRLITVSLPQMWHNKIKAFLERQAIRDAYDLEYIFKKGGLDMKGIDERQKEQIINQLNKFTKNDFKVTLGSLLEKEERDYYVKNGFKILINALK